MGKKKSKTSSSNLEKKNSKWKLKNRGGVDHPGTCMEYTMSIAYWVCQGKPVGKPLKGSKPRCRNGGNVK